MHPSRNAIFLVRPSYEDVNFRIFFFWCLSFCKFCVEAMLIFLTQLGCIVPLLVIVTYFEKYILKEYYEKYIMRKTFWKKYYEKHFLRKTCWFSWRSLVALWCCLLSLRFLRNTFRKIFKEMIYPWQSLVVEFGGALALFMGFSFITFGAFWFQ